MKLIKLEIEGYGSFKSQSWCPGDLNVLIGPNASGKSNLLRVLETLSLAAGGGLERDIEQKSERDSVLRYGDVSRSRLRAKMARIPACRDEAQDALMYEVTFARLGSSSSHRIESEILGNFDKVETGESREPLNLLVLASQQAVACSMDSKRFKAPPNSGPDDEALFSGAAGPLTAGRFVADFKKELADRKIHQDYYTRREAPSHTPRGILEDTRVDADGQNIISVLQRLYSRNRGFRREINTAMHAAFGEDFEKLVFRPTADERIRMQFLWRSMKSEQSAADPSGGTLRFLFLLAVLANPSPPPLIAIDQPETGLHPSMLPIVAEFARESANRSQVILTTHSPGFLDAFREDVPTITVVKREDGQTVLHVVSRDSLSYWLKHYTLGELFRSNELEAMK
jgi:predicted ATPase